MKKIGFLFILMWFLSHVSFAQIELKGTWDGSDGSHPQSSYDGGSFRPDLSLDRKPSTNHDRDRGGSSSSSGNTYSGPDFIGSWGGNLRNSDVAYYITERNTLRWEKDNTEAISILQELNDQLSSDCIDINQLQSIHVRFKRLSSNQRSVLGYEGDKALAELVARLHNAKPDYDKYSKMALDIKNNSFSKVDKDVMHEPYEELNGYLRQFLSKEEFDRAKIEYGKCEKSQIVNGVYARIRSQESKHNYKKTVNSGSHLALQKTTNSLVDNFKVGAMAVKNVSEGRKQLADLYGDELVPKPVLLDKLEKGINTVNDAIDAKGMFVKAFSGDWEGAVSDYMGKAKEKLIDPLNDCAIGLGATVTGSYQTIKRVFNFKETMTTLVNDTWNGVKDAIQSIERGENPNSVWNKVIIRTEQKDINTINKGIKRSF
jgi:hypothetical protein